jgi:hypothetical protein
MHPVSMKAVTSGALPADTSFDRITRWAHAGQGVSLSAHDLHLIMMMSTPDAIGLEIITVDGKNFRHPNASAATIRDASAKSIG